jgi:hypothetical protein
MWLPATAEPFRGREVILYAVIAEVPPAGTRVPQTEPPSIIR